MPRCNGSYVGIDATPTNTSASGIWTVREAERYLRADKWPSTPAVPGAPTPTAGNAEVSLTWTAPTGGSPPTDYVVQYSSNSGSTWTTFSDGVSTSTSATVTGLTNGTSYIFRIQAINALGEGPFGSASASVTPSNQPTPELLLHFDGTNGSTTFTDSSPSPYSLGIQAGSPQITTSNSKFGGAALNCNGGEIGLSSGTFSDLSGGDFTVECWVYRPTGTGSTTVFALGNTGVSPPPGFHFWLNGATVHVDDFAAGQYSGGTVPEEEWVHLAVVRESGDYKVYVNGTQAGSAVTAGPGAGPYETVFIGGWTPGSFTSNLLIDELRVVLSAVYTGNFTPPTAAF
jgi:hypothetical protein